MPDPAYDIVLLGATGFTGELTAAYLAENAGDTRWALAGRNLAKLKQTRTRLAAIAPAAAELALVSADSSDPVSMRALAESTRVVISTVGPYILYGEPLVAACAAAGTGYVDLTGEPEFVDRMWLRHHEQAQSTGARLVHCCGFDSIPHDLGVLYTVNQLPVGVPLALEGYVRAGGTFSGGTFHSAVQGLGRLRQTARVAAERRRAEPRPAGRSVQGVTGRPRHDDIAGGWIVPAPLIDPQVILRSARALDRYGPQFSYGHYIVVKRLATIGALAAGTGTLAALAQLKPTRDLLLKLKSPGDGPTIAQRERAWFRVRIKGEGGGERVVCEVTGGDPGYGETAKMLAESALCLAHDRLPQTAGQLTPAVAMGQALIERLQRAGIGFQTVRDEPL